MGMQLPVPVDQAMNDALYDITGGSFYLGISDETVEDDFRNIYTDTTITFANWDRVSIAAILIANKWHGHLYLDLFSDNFSILHM